MTLELIARKVSNAPEGELVDTQLAGYARPEMVDKGIEWST